MSKEKRITSCGNSTAITISVDELAHLHRSKGDTVIVSKIKGNALMIRPGQKTLPGKRTYYC